MEGNSEMHMNYEWIGGVNWYISLTWTSISIIKQCIPRPHTSPLKPIQYKSYNTIKKCNAQCLNVIIFFKRRNTAKMDCVNQSLESSELLRKRRNTCSLQLFRVLESHCCILRPAIFLWRCLNSPTCYSWTWEGAVKPWHVYCRSCQCC